MDFPVLNEYSRWCKWAVGVGFIPPPTVLPSVHKSIISFISKKSSTIMIQGKEECPVYWVTFLLINHNPIPVMDT